MCIMLYEHTHTLNVKQKKKPLTVQSLIRYHCGSLEEKDVAPNADSQGLASELSGEILYQGCSYCILELRICACGAVNENDLHI